MTLSGLAKLDLLAAACLLAGVSLCAQPIPASTAIPVVLTHSVAAGQAHPGDPVTAKTLQEVLLPGGRVLPRGTDLTGQVVASTPFVFDATPYAVQKPSVLSIRFDTIAAPGATIPVALEVRAVAGPVASHEAEIPHSLDEIDWSGTRILVGGESFSPLEKTVFSPDGNVAGYRRPQGIFARLLAEGSVNPESNFTCEATSSEQSVAIFSANACGVYGIQSVFLAQKGSPDGASLSLASQRRSVRLYAGTTALLQVISSQ